MNRDIEIMARTLYGEARSEGIDGMRAVGHVILNRSRDRRWPDTVADVCLQAKQFSAWNHNDANFRAMMEADESNPTFARALWVTIRLLCGDDTDDATLGANHYHVSSMLAPSWSDPKKLTVRIGRHSFFRL